MTMFHNLSASMHSKSHFQTMVNLWKETEIWINDCTSQLIFVMEQNDYVQVQDFPYL
jgi:hypothetical protein